MPPGQWRGRPLTIPWCQRSSAELGNVEVGGLGFGAKSPGAAGFVLP
jgi:hypothetical protein